MPLIRLRDEKEKVIKRKKERKKLTRGRPAAIINYLKQAGLVGCEDNIKQNQCLQESPNHQHLCKFLTTLSGILLEVFLSHHSLHPIPAVTLHFLPVLFSELNICLSSVTQDAVFSYISQLVSEELSVRTQMSESVTSFIWILNFP